MTSEQIFDLLDEYAQELIDYGLSNHADKLCDSIGDEIERLERIEAAALKVIDTLTGTMAYCGPAMAALREALAAK